MWKSFIWRKKAGKCGSSGHTGKLTGVRGRSDLVHSLSFPPPNCPQAGSGHYRLFTFLLIPKISVWFDFIWWRQGRWCWTSKLGSHWGHTACWTPAMLMLPRIVLIWWYGSIYRRILSRIGLFHKILPRAVLIHIYDDIEARIVLMHIYMIICWTGEWEWDGVAEPFILPLSTSWCFWTWWELILKRGSSWRRRLSK